MQIAMLGPLEVRTDSGVASAISGVRLARLLIALALHPGQVVATGYLVDAVWDDPPEETANAVQALVSRLRRSVPGINVTSRSQGYVLDIQPGAVDARHFEHVLAAARRVSHDEPASAAGMLRDALAMWRGPALVDAGEAAFARSARARLDEMRLTAMQERIDADLRSGATSGLIAELEGLVAAYPLREAFVKLLMRASHAAGDRGRALAAYESARTRLDDELGVLPSADLAAEHLRILRADDEARVAPTPNVSDAARGEARAGRGATQPDAAPSQRARGKIPPTQLSEDASAPSAGATTDARGASRSTNGGRPNGHRPDLGPISAMREPPPRFTNLRAEISSFVGREHDIEVLRGLVDQHRLVTLTGPGGAGKTRLAAHIARERLEATTDGVWLVELAPVTDPADVVLAMLGVLGVRHGPLVRSATSTTMGRRDPGGDPEERLVSALRDRAVLLIVDNCEHVIGAAADIVATVLGACQHVQVLTTSREPLGVTGEALWPVEPLALPPAAPLPAADLAEYASVRLLAQRAAAVRPGFAVTEGNAATVTRIVRSLDGMPLAIELAAARLRSIPADQLAERLDDRFAVLTAGSRTALPRHQTLRAVVDWSWDLLSDSEQVVWRRLATFTGGATLGAAESICADDALGSVSVLDALSALVDKSLLAVRDDEAEPRYHMLETIRAYGLMKLDESGEAAEVRARHAAYFRDLAHAASDELLGRDQLDWFARLTADHDNLNTAVRNAIAARDWRTAIRIVSSLGWYWWLRGHRTEGVELVRAAIAIADPDPVGQEEREDLAAAYVIGALLIVDASTDMAVPHEWFDTAIGLIADIAVPNTPLLRMAKPMQHIFEVAMSNRPPADFDIDMPVDDPNPWIAATARVMRAHVHLNYGREHESAAEDFAHALDAFREVGERWGIAFSLVSLGGLAAWRGEIGVAIANIEEALRAVIEMGALEDRVWFRTQLARLLWVNGERERAYAALAIADRDAKRIGMAEAQATYAYAAADFARWDGDVVRAADHIRRAEELGAFQHGAPQLRAVVMSTRAFIEAARGDLEEARRHHREALELAVSSVDAPVIANVLVGLADVALADGDAEFASTILGASAGVRGSEDRSLVDGLRVTAAATAVLGTERFQSAYRRGLTSTTTQIGALVGIDMPELTAAPDAH